MSTYRFTDNQYSVILLLFFVSIRIAPSSTSRRKAQELNLLRCCCATPPQVSYVLFEVPSNMMLTRLPPSIYLSALCFLWGAVVRLSSDRVCRRSTISITG